MSEFINNLFQGTGAGHRLAVVVMILFGVLWVMVRMEARKHRARPAPFPLTTEEHLSPVMRGNYEKRRFKPVYRRMLEMAELTVVFGCALAMDYYLGGRIYAGIETHSYHFGKPETLFVTGFFCGGVYLTFFSLSEFFGLLRR